MRHRKLTLKQTVNLLFVLFLLIIFAIVKVGIKVFAFGIIFLIIVLYAIKLNKLTECAKTPYKQNGDPIKRAEVNIVHSATNANDAKLNTEIQSSTPVGCEEQQKRTPRTYKMEIPFKRWQFKPNQVSGYRKKNGTYVYSYQRSNRNK